MGDLLQNLQENEAPTALALNKNCDENVQTFSDVVKPVFSPAHPGKVSFIVCLCVCEQEEAAGGGRGQREVAEPEHHRKFLSLVCWFCFQ